MSTMRHGIGNVIAGMLLLVCASTTWAVETEVLMIKVTAGDAALSDWPVCAKLDVAELMAYHSLARPLQIKVYEGVTPVTKALFPMEGAASMPDNGTLAFMASGMTSANTTRTFTVKFSDVSATLPAFQDLQSGGIPTEEWSWNAGKYTVYHTWSLGGIIGKKVSGNLEYGLVINSQNLKIQFDDWLCPLAGGGRVLTPISGQAMQLLTNDPAVPANRWICRLHSRAQFGTGTTPKADYYFTYFKDSPLVLVEAKPDRDASKQDFVTVRMIAPSFPDRPFTRASFGNHPVVMTKTTSAGGGWEPTQNYTYSLNASAGVSKQWAALCGGDWSMGRGWAIGMIGTSLSQIAQSASKQYLYPSVCDATKQYDEIWRGEPVSWKGYWYFGEATRASTNPADPDQFIEYTQSLHQVRIEAEETTLASQCATLRAALPAPYQALNDGQRCARLMLNAAESRMRQGLELRAAKDLIDAGTYYKTYMTNPDGTEKVSTSSFGTDPSRYFIAVTNWGVGLLWKVTRNGGTDKYLSLDQLMDTARDHPFLCAAVDFMQTPQVDGRSLWSGWAADSAATDWKWFNASTATLTATPTFTTTSSGVTLSATWNQPASTSYYHTTGGQSVQGFTAVATVVVPQGGGMSTWTVDVQPSGTGSVLQLWEASFPRISGLKPVPKDPIHDGDGQDYLTLPFKSGMLIPDPTSGAAVSLPYPGQASMQFMGYYQEPDGGGYSTGLYMASQDGAMYQKEFIARPMQEDTSLTLEINHLAPAAGTGAARVNPPYSVVIDKFGGNWYDAAYKYSSWARTQSWAVSIAPTWFKNSHLTLYGTTGGATPDTLAVSYWNWAASLQGSTYYNNAPAIYNWYQWLDRGTSSTLHMSNPEVYSYNSPSSLGSLLHYSLDSNGDGIDDGIVYDLQTNHNMYVAPYLMSLMWDELWTDSRGVNSYQAEGGVNSAVKEPSGTVRKIDYDGRNALVVVCPHTDQWCNKMATVVTDLMTFRPYTTPPTTATKPYGVYLDLSASSVTLDCFVGNHANSLIDSGQAHPVGGGSYAGTGMKEMLRRVRTAGRTYRSDFIVMAEGQTECYMDCVDTYLMYGGVRDTLMPLNIPMFQVVYGDLIRPYGMKGWSTQPYPAADLEVANAFVFGSHVGRVGVSDPSITAQSNIHKQFAKQVARRAASPILASGRMVRPPTITYDSGLNSTILYAAKLAVVAGAWQNSDSPPQTCLVFAHAESKDSSSETTFTCTNKPSDYGVPAGWNLYELQYNGAAWVWVLDRAITAYNVNTPINKQLTLGKDNVYHLDDNNYLKKMKLLKFAPQP